MWATDLSVAYAVSYRSGGPVSGQARKEGRPVTSAAIYARVSSARQKKDQTIGSQTAALRDRAGQLGAELPEEWVLEQRGARGRRWCGPRWSGCVTWSPGSGWMWCCATPRTGWPASSPTRRC